MQTITHNTATKILESHVIMGRLMVLFGKSQKTIQRWVEDKDVRLTIKPAIKIIKEETGLADKEILEETKAEKAA